MRSSIFSMILSIFTLVLIGWVLATLYDAYTQFAIIMKNPTPPLGDKFIYLAVSNTCSIQHPFVFSLSL